MKKFKSLNRYQKGILLFMAAMALVFLAVYFRTISRVGFVYQDKIFTPGQENGSTVYSGKIQGQQAHFTVSQDKTVVFQYGDKTYGPYTAKEDPAAIPEKEERTEDMTGVELRQGETVLFRGGVLDIGGYLLLYDEDGAAEDEEISFADTSGMELEEDGNAKDPVEPPASSILELMNDPELTHKGQWFSWFGAVCICVLNAFSILFADELFRWNLAFQIRNADHAEPSDWEITGRYIGWTAMPMLALILFITGLQ